MRNYTNGQTYRHSFVYIKAHIKPDVFKQLSGFISTRNLEKRVFLNSNNASTITSYETTVLQEEHGLTSIPVLVVVIYGNNWQNFVDALLQYNECFPSALLKGISLPEYLYLDENRQYSDLIGLNKKNRQKGS